MRLRLTNSLTSEFKWFDVTISCKVIPSGSALAMQSTFIKQDQVHFLVYYRMPKWLANNVTSSFGSLDRRGNKLYRLFFMRWSNLLQCTSSISKMVSLDQPLQRKYRTCTIQTTMWRANLRLLQVAGINSTVDMFTTLGYRSRHCTFKKMYR